MWNLKSILYLVSVLLLSLFIVVFRPQMHKQAIITDSEYEFVEISAPQTPVQTTNTNLDLKPVQQPNSNIGMNNNDFENRQIRTVNNTTSKQSNSVRQQPKYVQQPQQQSVQKPVPKQIQQAQPKTQPKHETESLPKPKTVQVKPQNLETGEPKHILTEQEEIIAWNKWRSNLQNQVMMDSKVFAPLGTAFKFSFTVDKFGNMSNVKVWSLNPSYSNYAVKVIKPVLMNYRNKPILNFPEGTKRIIVNVDGGFVISRTSRYSSPSDYHDYERVKH